MKAKTDIIFLSHLSDLANGAEKSLLEIIKEAKDKSLNIHVVLPGLGKFSSELKKISVPFTVISMDWWLKQDGASAIIKNAESMEMAIDIINNLKPNLVVTNTIVNPTLAIAAAITHTPHAWIIREFGDNDYHFDFRLGTESTLRLVDEMSDAVFFNSVAVQRYYAKKFTHNTDGKLLLPYVEMPQIPEVFAELKTKLTTKSPLLVLVGKIHEAKGQFDAVRALKILRDEGHNPLLALVGQTESQDYFDAIQTYLNAHQLNDNVVWTDNMDNPFGVLAMADISLMCSRSEAFGRVTIESMLLGRPVIGTSSGGTAEIISNNKTGLLYTPGDYKQLAVCINSLIKDKQLADRLALAGKRATEQVFTKEKSHGDFFAYVEKQKKQKKSSSLNLSVFSDFLFKNNMLRQQIAGLQAEITKLEIDNEAAKNQLDSIYQSHSWKMTSGLRKISDRVKRVDN